jgi:1-deoxy-D-xylulose-5-phosphate synthase
VEDGCIIGGMGSAVLEFMADNNYRANVVRLGIPDKWIEHGEQSQLYEECGFSAIHIKQKVIELMNDKERTKTIKHI